MKYFILSVVFFLSLYTVNNQYFTYAQNISYVTDFELAKSIAKDTKQNIVLILSASWCGYCNQLKNDLNSIENLDNKIICIIDVDENKKLSRIYKAKSLPTSVLLDSEATEVSRLSGYDKIKYSDWLKNSSKKIR